MFLEKRSPELFNVDETISFPVILLEMDESVCLFVFLLHVLPRQSKTLEAGEEILV